MMQNEGLGYKGFQHCLINGLKISKRKSEVWMHFFHLIFQILLDFFLDFLMHLPPFHAATGFY